MKASANVADHHLRGLRESKKEHPTIRRRIVVSTDARARSLAEGIEIPPAERFARLLWDGELF